MLTMKQARKMHANRVMVSPAVFDMKVEEIDGIVVSTQRVRTKRRVNRRQRDTTPFREWARSRFRGFTSTDLCKKLDRIVNGANGAKR